MRSLTIRRGLIISLARQPAAAAVLLFITIPPIAAALMTIGLSARIILPATAVTGIMMLPLLHWCLRALVLGAALRTPEEARSQADSIAASPTGAEEPGEGAQVAEIARSLLTPLKSKNPYFGEHLEVVSQLALSIGLKMSLSSNQLNEITLGALLHDVGKIGVPDQILQKAGRLTEEEYEVVKRHSVLGAEVLASIEELAPAAPAVRHHHERFDGKGYPDGLHGEDIPLAARVISVADAFDSMTRDRPYGYGISREDALAEIKRNSGTQFDPRVVNALLEVVWEPGDRRADSAG
jgi:HD-GYP domain-containing protein (c-di-GMP phosphodiesterase class II)